MSSQKVLINIFNKTKISGWQLLFVCMKIREESFFVALLDRIREWEY